MEKVHPDDVASRTRAWLVSSTGFRRKERQRVMNIVLVKAE
jgi:hypothetical protein